MRWIFEHMPFTEVLVRIIYKKLLEVGILKKRIVPKEKSNSGKKIDIKLLDAYFHKKGISKGDILIVHSSMKGIKQFGLSPEEIVHYLCEKVGNEGTLIMPTFPLFEKNNKKLVYDEKYTQEYFYDVETSKGWTGIITENFRKMDNVVRSKFPCNTLAALGKDAEKMFCKELDSDLSFSTKSAWKYCSTHHAKVLFLGIHAHHSISEIHIAEDILDDKWPIHGWYAEKDFNIIDEQTEMKKKCRVRKDFWTKYLTEYRCCYQLQKINMLEEDYIDSTIPISFIPDLSRFEEYVTSQALKGDLLIFKIPKKYWRKK